MTKPTALTAIPTHILTGFLGAGKTTVILNLLKSKPESERWAVLVNEFGEIGIDGSLMQGQQAHTDQVFIREVPGGCMCCASGVPMQIALNELLKQARPDRLLIEPTGLGHPKEVLKALQAEHYQSVLALQKVVTLVDARKLSDTRYTEHQTFIDQVAIADIVVGSKADLYEAGDAQRLMDFVQTLGVKPTQVLLAEQGSLELDVVVGDTIHVVKLTQPLRHEHADHRHSDTYHSNPHSTSSQDSPVLETGYACSVNEGEGFSSIGWRFSPTYVFRREQILNWINHVTMSKNIERIKAVIKTSEGYFAYNVTGDSFSETEFDDCAESRIEIITTAIDDCWQDQIIACTEVL